MRICRDLFAVIVLLAPVAAFAQEAAPAAPVVASAEVALPAEAAPAEAALTTLDIAAGTPIVVEIVTPLSSTTSQTGQTFELRLLEPVMVGDQIAIPAGTMGGGEVIDAAPSGMGGRQGKLVVSGRYLDLNGQRIRIRGMTLNVSGQSMVNTSTAVSLMPYVGVVGGFIRGGNIEIPTGSRADARIAVATTVPAAPAPVADAAVPAVEETPSSEVVAPDLTQATEGQQQ
jgi:hypothetical protein